MKRKSDKSEQLFTKAKTLFPGGVNSPVRAFKSVGGIPVFMQSGKGSKIKDVDGNEYIDFCGSWGPLILGHANDTVLDKVNEVMRNGTSFGAPTALENELAELILNFNQFIEKIRFVSSGTEAVMSAIRLARGYTKRNKILKFEGCYHGHVDSLLVKAGSGLVTFGNTASAGVPESFANETITVPLNNVEALNNAFDEYGADIAAVIIEPVPANNGLLLQDKSFLIYLKQLCTSFGSLLIFDEVISGFRLSFCGAAGLFGIQPDIITYGKIIGGGFPVGAYGASAEIMSCVSPEGQVYQAGTLSGNPVAMAAGIAQLTQCLRPNFYYDLEVKTKKFVDTIQTYTNSKKYDFKIFHLGSIFWIAFSKKEKIQDSESIVAESMQYFKVFYHELLNRGVYIGPSGYEVGFVSDAHNDEDLQKAAQIICEVLDFTFNAQKN
jgi:glutamate-1-semialdehyde 2,1-aminomutase